MTDKELLNAARVLIGTLVRDLEAEGYGVDGLQEFLAVLASHGHVQTGYPCKGCVHCADTNCPNYPGRPATP